MAEQMKATLPADSFDYELYEGDPDHLTTVVSAPMKPSPYIDPASITLKYQIGHGLFGDVWLATHHRSADDYDESHEVAVKMLYPIQEDHIKSFLSKFEDLWVSLNSRQPNGVCWLHGISLISGKICVVIKSYEGSVGDLLARLKGGKLPLPDILRYGIELVNGIQVLHSVGILVLNLKPTNFLLNDQKKVVIGDFGIPYLLLGIPLADSDLALRLGTPNYMAPEQWEPEIRGPITYETDSWGFGCSIVEMLTGVPVWFGRSNHEIYHSVVINQQKPQLPSGLPPAVENILNGCFEYDLRNRPLMQDILQVFERSLNAASSDGEWIGIENTLLVDKSTCTSYTSWSLSKDHLQVGDIVRSRKVVNSGSPQTMAVTEGTVVGLEKDTDQDGYVLVRIPSLPNPLRLNVSTLERVTSGLAAGDWVRLIKENSKHSSVGILHFIQREGNVAVGFLGLETLWLGHSSDIQIAEPYFVGQFVRLKSSVMNPRFEWPRKGGVTWATGRISQILPNGCLDVKFPSRFVIGGECSSFLADPAEVERISFDTCPGVVEKYQHVEDFHWAVRPLAIALGLFTSVKLGVFVGRNVGTKLKGKGSKNQAQNDSRSARRRSVAKILFKDGAPARNYFQESDREAEAKNVGKAVKDKNKDKGGNFREISHQIAQLNTNSREPTKRCDEISWGNHGIWTHEQKARAARLEKQLKARWALEELIEDQLNSFQAQYNRVTVPTRLKDVAQLLMPKGTPANELAALTWLGDWRPSSILELLGSLSSYLSESNGMKQVLPQLVNEIRIEEAIIDEEMAEIQANCVLHLPFGPIKSRSKIPPLDAIQNEFEKIHKVLTKAQKLRSKALELVVKKVLSQTDAAEFLVAFSAIQDSIHQFATHPRLQKGSTSSSQPFVPKN
ncbi:hypothetical protein ACH5RR_024624 [Cinchona calisaya]|uniref:Protein kinase domain-containing protein n=1 Tax=Cinchona calisaya TaxID=153742 RepID=A0ABD2Z1D2_9GENT